ncbi:MULTISPECIES: HAD family hydrolase [Streptomyces]|uniref:HAD family hydrolase n=1 Tax=Streptomyces TaxID=1883 RepID=UPI00224C82A8|nr:HAD family hydrolase [Streptomyces viridodiastaticus]MCX4624539.1 HAD family hydrolase [Streptomyces viridodiastaticus]
MPASKIALFDLDDTLTDHAAAFALWAAEFSQATGIPHPWITEADARHAGARYAFFADIKETFGIQKSIAAQHVAYQERTAELVPHRPEVCAALEALTADGWSLGVVTNGSPAAQRTKLEVSRLDRFFTTVVISGDYGVRKPHEALFRLALDDLQADKDTWTAMIGDCLATDIAGGLRAGLHTIWVSHGRSRRRGDPVPHHTVHTTVDACEWLSVAVDVPPPLPALTH